MTDPNGRYKVLESLPAAPGECFVCKSVRRGPFVDTGIADPFLGVFYICRGCLTEMTNELPPVAPVLTEEEIEISQQLDSARNEGFVQGVASAKAALDDLASLFIDRNFVSAADSADALSVPVPEIVSGNSGGQESDRVSADSGSKQGGGSVKRKGRDDVPSATGDGPFDLAGI